MFALVGRDPATPPPDLDEWLGCIDTVRQEPSDEALQAGSRRVELFRVQRADGETRWLQAWSSTDSDPHGNPVRIWGATAPNGSSPPAPGRTTSTGWRRPTR